MWVADAYGSTLRIKLALLVLNALLLPRLDMRKCDTKPAQSGGVHRLRWRNAGQMRPKWTLLAKGGRRKSIFRSLNKVDNFADNHAEGRGHLVSNAPIRLATAADLPAINDIYNYYVPRSTCTYQLEPETIEARQAWFDHHPPDKYPVLVAEIGGRIAGWGSLSKFRERAAYSPTVEASVYIHHEVHRRGLGKLLLVELIERARAAGFHSVIGGASADQTASIALQESLGFRRIAHLVEVGYKFGKWLDVIYLQLMLE